MYRPIFNSIGLLYHRTFEKERLILYPKKKNFYVKSASMSTSVSVSALVSVLVPQCE